MSIQFVDAGSVRAENLIILLYGAPGTGKTSLGLTAEQPILLDFDGGVHRAGGKEGKAVVQAKNWSDIAELQAEDLKDYRTVVIDTLGSFLECLTREIVRELPKQATPGGGLSMQGYGVLRRRANIWFRNLRAMDKHVVFLAHVKEEIKGDDVVNRLEAEGSFKATLYKAADLFGMLSIKGKERMLSFNPSEINYGKNVGLPDRAFPRPEVQSDTLAKIITEALTSINAIADRQAEQQRFYNGITAQVAAMEDVSQMDAVLNMIKELREEQKDEVTATVAWNVAKQAAKTKNWVFDKKANAFNAVEPPPEESPPPAAEADEVVEATADE